MISQLINFSYSHLISEILDLYQYYFINKKKFESNTLNLLLRHLTPFLCQYSTSFQSVNAEPQIGRLLLLKLLDTIVNIMVFILILFLY